MTQQAQHAKQKNNTAKTGRQSAVIPELQTGLDVLQRAIADPGLASPDDILALQRSYGNQAVTGLIQTQPRTVLRQEEEEELQMEPLSRGFEVSTDLEQRLDTQKGNGKPLSPDVRAFMEPRFGVDFGDVRVHTDSESVQMSRDLNARSFTHGADVYFNADRYNPSTNAGKRLLAHELTHVVQQTARQPTEIQTRHEDGYVQRWRWRTKKSRVYEGKVGGKRSQEKVVTAMTMSPGDRASALKTLLVDNPLKNNLNGFNQVLPLLTGGGNLSDQFSEQTGKDLGQRITGIFGRGVASRGQYLLDVLNTGKPTAKSKFALRAGLLTGTSFTFGRGSGRREHGVNKDLIELAQQLSREELNGILQENALTKPLTKKTLKLLRAQLEVKGKEEEEEGAEGGAQLVKQVELFKAYQDQLIKMVQDRPVRVFGSRSKHKKRLFNDLQQWAKDKPPQIIEKLLNEGSRFYQTLTAHYKEADVTYITKLMSKPEQKPETEQEEEQSEEEAAIFQQVEAILGRQEVKWRFKRWRQKGNIKAQLEQILFGEGGLENVLAAVKRQYGENWEEQLKDKFKKAGLKDIQVEELLSKFRYGKKSAGDIYQQLKKRVTGWRKRPRWSRTTLDLIQQLRPGTSEYELVRRDKALLRGIRRRSDKEHWAQARAVLNVSDGDIEEGALEAKLEVELEQEAGTEWGVRENESVENARERQTKRWAALIDAELTSISANKATLYKHVFSAQQDAWNFATVQSEEKGERRDYYIGYIRAVHNKIAKQDELPDRLKNVFAEAYAQRLTVHDLMDVAKKRGGKRRTDKDMVKFAIQALSGQELLDEWSDFDEENLVLKVKAEWWDQKGEDHKSFRDLLKRPDRIEMERLLLGRLAEECQKAPEFKARAAGVMEIEDQDQAARYVAQRTRAIGHMETAQKFAKGKQWSRFSTRSLVYKEAQAEYLSKLRSTQTDIKTVGTEERKRKIEELEQSEETLKSEEAAFKALREKYNQRLKTIVTAITGTLLATLGLVFTGGLSAGPLMAGIWSALTAMISKGIGALVEYTNEGNIVVTDKLRELFVDSVIGFIGGIMGNVSLAIRSMGAQDIYGKSAKVGAKLFGKPGLAILGSWAQETATTVVGSPIHAVDRLLRSTSVTRAWQDARDEFKQKFEDLPLNTLQSYAQGFLSSSFIETVIASGGGDLLYQSDLPKEEILGEGEGGMESRETFEKYGAIRPFEFDSWKGFWESIVKGSQVNTTDYGSHFIVYEDGVPQGWEFDTNVLKTDEGPQTLGNAFKAMGYKVAMGGLEWPFRKGISMVTGAQPTLTERKGKGKQTGEEYEKFGALRLGEGGESEFSDAQLTGLANLTKEQLGGLNREKLVELAAEFTGDELARLARLTVHQISLDNDKLKVLAKLTADQLVLLQRSRSYSPDALANQFNGDQSAKLAVLTSTQFIGLLGGLGQLDELATLTSDQLEMLAKLTVDQLNRINKEQLVKLAKKFDQGHFEKLGSFEPQKLVALAQLEPGQLGALAQLSPEQIATLNNWDSLIPLAQKFDPGQIAKLAQLDPDLLRVVLAGKKRDTLAKLSEEQLGKLVQLPGDRIIELTKRSQEKIVTELEK